MGNNSGLGYFAVYKAVSKAEAIFYVAMHQRQRFLTENTNGNLTELKDAIETAKQRLLTKWIRGSTDTDKQVILKHCGFTLWLFYA